MIETHEAKTEYRELPWQNRPESERLYTRAQFFNLIGSHLDGVGLAALTYSIPVNAPSRKNKVIGGAAMLLLGRIFFLMHADSLEWAKKAESDEEKLKKVIGELSDICNNILDNFGHEQINSAGQHSLVTNSGPAVVTYHGKEECVSIYAPITNQGIKNPRIAISGLKGFIEIRGDTGYHGKANLVGTKEIYKPATMVEVCNYMVRAILAKNFYESHQPPK